MTARVTPAGERLIAMGVAMGDADAMFDAWRAARAAVVAVVAELDRVDNLALGMVLAVDAGMKLLELTEIGAVAMEVANRLARAEEAGEGPPVVHLGGVVWPGEGPSLREGEIIVELLPEQAADDEETQP